MPPRSECRPVAKPRHAADADVAAMTNCGTAQQFLDVAWRCRAAMIRPLECAPRKMSLAIGLDRGVDNAKFESD
jgi:hypothetical protein